VVILFISFTKPGYGLTRPVGLRGPARHEVSPWARSCLGRRPGTRAAKARTAGTRAKSARHATPVPVPGPARPDAHLQPPLVTSAPPFWSCTGRAAGRHFPSRSGLLRFAALYICCTFILCLIESRRVWFRLICFLCDFCYALACSIVAVEA